jgi:hypothetical protein
MVTTATCIGIHTVLVLVYDGFAIMHYRSVDTAMVTTVTCIGTNWQSEFPDLARQYLYIHTIRL